MPAHTKTTFCFHVKCGTGENENPCKVEISAKKEGLPDFKVTFEFPPGTSGKDVAAYFAKKLADAGYEPSYKDGEPCLEVNDVTEPDQHTQEGLQITCVVGGDVPEKDKKKKRKPDDPRHKSLGPSIGLERGEIQSPGSMAIYVAGLHIAESGMRSVRINEVFIDYEPHSTSRDVLAQLARVMESAGWRIDQSSGDSVGIVETGLDFEVTSVLLVPSHTLPAPNDDRWFVRFDGAEQSERVADVEQVRSEPGVQPPCATCSQRVALPTIPRRE